MAGHGLLQQSTKSSTDSVDYAGQISTLSFRLMKLRAILEEMDISLGGMKPLFERMVKESVTLSRQVSPANQIASLGQMIALLEKRISINNAKKDRLARWGFEVSVPTSSGPRHCQQAGGGGGVFGGSEVTTAAAGPANRASGGFRSFCDTSPSRKGHGQDNSESVPSPPEL
jgi:hypothetical protein